MNKLLTTLENTEGRKYFYRLSRNAGTQQLVWHHHIYEKFKDTVFNLALHYVHNTHDAEEIMQDVFVKIFLHSQKYRAESEFKTWIYRITVHCALDHLKQKNRKKRWFLFGAEDLNTAHNEPTSSSLDHPGIALEQKKAMERIFKCIHQLPEQQKTALILLKIEQLSQKETAEIMHISTKAVESLLQRAKKNLQEKLNQSEG